MSSSTRFGANWPTEFAALKDLVLGRASLITVFGRYIECNNGSNNVTRVLSSGLVPYGQTTAFNAKTEVGWELENAELDPVEFTEHAHLAPWCGLFCSDIPHKRIIPFVLAAEGGLEGTALPDPRFVISYQLVPRLMMEQDTIAWDDHARPERPVIHARLGWKWQLGTPANAFVKVNRDYLQDYCAQLEANLILTYFEQRHYESNHQLKRVLAGKRETRLPVDGGVLRIVDASEFGNQEAIMVEISGYRFLDLPRDRLVSEARVGDLTWPDVGQIEGQPFPRFPTFNHVWIKDDVLRKFEDREDFSIHPPTGKVSFGYQWHVGYCRRVGRDWILLELKKLYEGAPPWVIKHYHKHAVSAPMDDFEGLSRERNIGGRAQALVEAYVDLCAALSRICSKILSDAIQPEAIGNHQIRRIQSSAWWENPRFSRLGNVAPYAATKNDFLARANTIWKALFESMNHGPVQRTLIACRHPVAEIGKLKSLKSLTTLVAFCAKSTRMGHPLPSQSATILDAMDERDREPTELIALFALFHFRTQEGHTLSNAKFENQLRRLGVAPTEGPEGYGLAIDRLFDQVTASILHCRRILDETNLD